MTTAVDLPLTDSGTGEPSARRRLIDSRSPAARAPCCNALRSHVTLPQGDAGSCTDGGRKTTIASPAARGPGHVVIESPEGTAGNRQPATGHQQMATAHPPLAGSKRGFAGRSSHP